ncbi:hypothetical protein DNTS_031995 [Danionella cerebrum]|uniref:Uncharacterized protein n=1 Tax=Danionella cerebrum TaxID=2873325 RepID=A0A553PYM9_9TELE|nr:hypothetical protein DNTS_031995 [Danionella translucida]
MLKGVSEHTRHSLLSLSLVPANISAAREREENRESENCKKTGQESDHDFLREYSTGDAGKAEREREKERGRER